jgi:hypothetical protein
LKGSISLLQNFMPPAIETPMKPSEKEIDDAKDWIINLDGNSDWPDHVNGVVERLKGDLI